jgi:DNA-binding transcriptional LysR family regulator
VLIPDVELRDLRIFLALAEELHFGRTAARLGLSQPAVSDAIRILESRLGLRLFDRTSRRVELTPAGRDLVTQLLPTVEALERVLLDAHDRGKGVTGVLRVGCTQTTFLPPVRALADAFTARHPACEVSFEEVDVSDPYRLLRQRKVDVVVNWLAVDEPDLSAGPVITTCRRVLAVSRNHPLAAREFVSIEDLADEVVDEPATTTPRAIVEAILPLHTPSGAPIRRRNVMPNVSESIAAVARGESVHPTMEGVVIFERGDMALVPICDMEPLPLGLIWRAAVRDARIAALAEVASSEGPWPVRGG